MMAKMIRIEHCGDDCPYFELNPHDKTDWCNACVRAVVYGAFKKGHNHPDWCPLPDAPEEEKDDE